MDCTRNIKWGNIILFMDLKNGRKKMFYSKLVLLKLILLMPITVFTGQNGNWRLSCILKIKDDFIHNKMAKINYFDMPYIASTLLLEVQLFVKNSFWRSSSVTWKRYNFGAIFSNTKYIMCSVTNSTWLCNG